MSRKIIKSYLLIAFGIFTTVSTTAQSHVIRPEISRAELFQTVNRDVTIERTGHKIVAHLDGKENSGVAWIKGLTFLNGTIEVDVKGKNLLQQSFLGIAFHGVNDTTFEDLDEGMVGLWDDELSGDLANLTIKSAKD